MLTARLIFAHSLRAPARAKNVVKKVFAQ